MLLSASNLGAWGVLYAVTPEIYPTRLRGAAAGAAAAACGRVAAIIAPLLMPWFLTLSGGNKAVAFIVFAAAFIHRLRGGPVPARTQRPRARRLTAVDDGVQICA